MSSMLARTDSPFFAETTPFGDLIDQMFNASLPWKMLKSLSPDQTKAMNFQPKLSVASDEHTYTVSAEVCGIPKDKINLEIHDHVLTIQGEKKDEREIKDEANPARTYHLQERTFGSFVRTLQLPDDADEEHINASHKDGVLTITIPRLTAKANAKTIQIA